jgi:hypothetical protein
LSGSIGLRRLKTAFRLPEISQKPKTPETPNLPFENQEQQRCIISCSTALERGFILRDADQVIKISIFENTNELIR